MHLPTQFSWSLGRFGWLTQFKCLQSCRTRLMYLAVNSNMLGPLRNMETNRFKSILRPSSCCPSSILEALQRPPCPCRTSLSAETLCMVPRWLLSLCEHDQRTKSLQVCQHKQAFAALSFFVRWSSFNQHKQAFASLRTLCSCGHWSSFKGSPVKGSVGDKPAHLSPGRGAMT